MSILNKLFGGARPSVDSVTFDVTGYLDQGKKGDGHIWFLSGGGGVALNFFGHPDLPKSLESVRKVEEFYRSRLTDKQKLVEFRLQTLDGARGSWLIIGQRRDQGTGMFYLGSLSILFRDFTFVIMVRCDEDGITGMREAVLTDLALREGQAVIESGKLVMNGFSYDDEQHDAKFPQHPLTRVRGELHRIAASVHIDSAIKSLPPFGLPEAVRH